MLDIQSMHMNLSSSRKKGFTLIELSIVLVIIGLLTASVLVGKDLIAAAEIRAMISQLEKYKLALNAFRTKYNGLPGDISASEATGFGFAPRSGGVGSGDQNGIIEACGADGSNGASEFLGCENILAWKDLSDAKMIDSSFTMAADVPLPGVTDFSVFFPTLKGNNKTFVHFFSKRYNPTLAGYPTNIVFKNALGMTGMVITDMSGQVSTTPTLAPQTAYAIDNKADDGAPVTGHVLGLTATSGFYDLVAPPNPVCHANSSGTVNLYPMDSETKSTRICKIIFIL